MFVIVHSLLDGRRVANPMTHKNAPQEIQYILSAGRTGTVFISKLFETYAPNIIAEHEPASSRYLMMMGNARNDFGLFKSLTRRWSRAHQNAHFSKGKKYIEINPFLCPITDTLPRKGCNLKVLHLVRHPADWSRSITSFKASTKLRAVIDYIPFAKPYPAPRPTGWTKLGNYEKSLWRWRWCNSSILTLKDAADKYVLIRYEDLFSEDKTVQMEAILKVFDVFDLPPPSDISDSFLRERVNPSPEIVFSENAKAEKDICGKLAEELGYAL
jgi:hypothetical protein